MQSSPDNRPHADSRGASDLHPPARTTLHTAGEFTPEVSPLDEFIYRGRLLSKQLVTGGKAGDLSQAHMNIQRSLGRAENERERSQSDQPEGATYNIAGNHQIAEPPPEDRPVSSYPRFSTATSDRDSIMSGATSVRDSNFTLMGGFLNPDRNPPNLTQLSNRHDSRHEYEFGRQSVRPPIEGDVGDDDVSPTSATTWTPFGQARAYDAEDIRVARSRPKQEEEHSTPTQAAMYARSRSQPPQQQRRPVQRQFSGDVDRRIPPRKDSLDCEKKYIAYTRHDPNSSGATSFGPPSRQDSAESETFQPFRRQQGPGNAERLHPNRQRSRDPERRFAPHRQDSGESEKKYLPYRQGSEDSAPSRRPSRQDSLESDRGRPVDRAYSPQLYTAAPRTTSPQAPTIPAMLATIRAVSPESMDGDSEPNYGITSAPLMAPTPHPFGPYYDHHGRRRASNASPRPGSAASDTPSVHSVGGTRLQKPTFNFSRPISNKSSSADTRGPPLDIPRQGSRENSPAPGDETFLPTPVSMTEEAAEHYEGPNAPVPSYIYSRFALPRGRELARNSLIFQEQPRHGQNHNQNHNQNQSQVVYQAYSPNPPAPTPFRPQSPNSPPRTMLQPAPASRGKSSHSRSPSQQHQHLQPTQLSQPTQSSRPPSSAPSSSPRPPHLSPSPASRGMGSRSPNPSSGSRSPNPQATSSHILAVADMSPEAHVQMGIDLHEAGSLQESTYHLRLAANGGHPTGMLLYALACRHGWGMRPNPKEGVSWLKKVSQIASSEVADAEAQSIADQFEKKGRKAQFALSIYELGVSHLNGWGTEMDKSLALSCFEIAGKWGDPDALSEAGFCYANAVGCKKDVKKSAKFYRMAEEKGVSMVGNSWIWKDKYLTEEEKLEKRRKEGGGGAGGGDHGKKESSGLFSRKKSNG